MQNGERYRRWLKPSTSSNQYKYNNWYYYCYYYYRLTHQLWAI